MTAQINNVNNGVVIVSLFNSIRIVDIKYFDTKRKANNFCKKYKYPIGIMNDNICCSLKYNQ